ncbi:MAG: bis-aminopropyl spermidine synthase family protein [Patescibacteria group bacterium]|nr:bis-aminopropyl spermidine synthase family protein [Patescibacteria group bacterium]MBU1952715.1 bis-aminopropyl spermidine synthase family protein [Patescibacteria group bacterium]
MSNLIEQIKIQNPDLKISEIEGLLFILRNEPEISNNALIRKSGLPKETLKLFKKSISDYLENSGEDEVTLNKTGKEVLSGIELPPYKWTLYPSDELTLSYNKVLEIRNKYDIVAKREYDQFLATPETTYNKARVAIDKGVVQGKNIAFIGDDDLVSLALASVCSSYKSITVFDIDGDLLSKVETGAKDLNFKNLFTAKYDVRKELNQKYLGRFDTVIFDPPYTKSGVTLFLQRAVELLGKVGGFEGKYIFMYYGNSFKSPEKTLKIQEIVNRFNLVIEDKINKFAQYEGAESVGSSSSLYVLKADKFTHPVDITFDSKNIYTYEKQEDEKFPFVDHVVLKVHDVASDLLISKGRLMGSMEKLCKMHRFKVVSKEISVFAGGGMTATFVLANSNLVVHTWPEFKALHIDLITCSPIFKKEVLRESVCEVFGTDRVEYLYIE